MQSRMSGKVRSLPLSHGPTNGRNQAHRRYRTSMKIGWAVHPHQRLTGFVELAGRGLVRELGHGGHDPAPSRPSSSPASASSSARAALSSSTLSP